jgi:hypothetical protein
MEEDQMAIDLEEMLQVITRELVGETTAGLEVTNSRESRKAKSPIQADGRPADHVRPKEQKKRERA